MESHQIRKQRRFPNYRLLVGTAGLIATLSASAATVEFTYTNLDGTPLTNDLVVTPVANQPYSDGQFAAVGLAKRTPTTNGYQKRVLGPANYSVYPYGLSNVVNTVYFAVPNDPGIFNFWALRISGGSTYIYTPGVNRIVGGTNVIVTSNSPGVYTISASTNVTTAQAGHATNSDYVLTAVLTNQSYASNMIGALQQAMHATNADNAALATNANNVTLPTLTNKLYASNLFGAAPDASHSTNADNVTIPILTNRLFSSNLVGGAAFANVATNAQYVTTPTITNQTYATNLIGNVAQATNATIASFVSGILTNRVYSSNSIGASAESIHATNADNVTLPTLTNKVYGSNITGTAATATNATLSSFVSGILTNQIYGSNVIGLVTNIGTATNATYVTIPTLTNQVYGSNVIGNVTVNSARATNADNVTAATLTNKVYATNLTGNVEAFHATNSDNVVNPTLTNKLYATNLIGSAPLAVASTTAQFVLTSVITNQHYASNMVGAALEANHSTNADNVTLPTLTNKFYGTNITGAAPEATHATNANNVTLATLTNKVYVTNFVGVPAEATHATNADNVTLPTLTNKAYASNIIGQIAFATGLASYVTNSPLTNTTYGSNVIGALTEAKHATNADNVTLPTLTNKVYATNISGAIAGPLNTYDTNALAQVIQFGGLTQIYYDDDEMRFYMIPGLHFLFNGDQVTNILGSNVVTAVTNAQKAGLATNAFFAGVATNVMNVTNAVLTNQFYGSNIIGGVAGAGNKQTNFATFPTPTTNAISLGGGSLPNINGTYFFRGYTNLDLNNVPYWTNANNFWVIRYPSDLVFYAFDPALVISPDLWYLTDFFQAVNGIPGRWSATPATSVAPTFSYFGITPSQATLGVADGGFLVGDGFAVTNIRSEALTGTSSNVSAVAFTAFGTFNGTFNGTGYPVTNVAIHEPTLRAATKLPSLGWVSFWDLGTGAALTATAVSNIVYKWETNGMQAAGWKYIWIDDGWQAASRSGINLVADATKFPNGLTASATHAHMHGFKFGTYTSFNISGTDGVTCGGKPNSSYESAYRDMQAFASWGIDAVKIDQCSGQPNSFQFRERMRVVGYAIEDIGRKMDILMTINTTAFDGSYPTPLFSASEINVWEDGQGALNSVSDVMIKATATTNDTSMIGPGHFREIGGASYMNGGSLSTTTNITRTWMTMAAIESSPMYIGDPDIENLKLLTNQEVTAIILDPGANCGRMVYSNNLTEVWIKPLQDPRKFAVAAINLNTVSSNVAILWTNVGWASNQLVDFRNLWSQSNTGQFFGSFTNTVPATNANLFLATFAYTGNGFGLTNSSHALVSGGHSALALTATGTTVYEPLGGWGFTGQANSTTHHWRVPYDCTLQSLFVQDDTGIGASTNFSVYLFTNGVSVSSSPLINYVGTGTSTAFAVSNLTFTAAVKQGDYCHIAFSNNAASAPANQSMMWTLDTLK